MRPCAHRILLGMLLVASCVAEDSDPTDETGFRVTTDWVGGSDVIGFHVVVSPVDCATGNPTSVHSVDVLVELDESLGSGPVELFDVFSDGAGHIFAGLVVEVDPGCFELRIEPARSIDGPSGTFLPSRDCGAIESGPVVVVEGQTTSLDALVSQCEGQADGVFVPASEPNLPPSIVLVGPVAIGYACEPIEMCAYVTDPNNDPLEIEWSQIGGPPLPQPLDIDPGLTLVGQAFGIKEYVQCARFGIEAPERHTFEATVYDLDENSGQLEQAFGTPSHGSDIYDVNAGPGREPVCVDKFENLLPTDGSPALDFYPGCPYQAPAGFFCDPMNAGRYGFDLNVTCPGGLFDAEASFPLCSDLFVCGNVVVEVGEQCDDGNTDDTDACPTTCLDAICGDGFVWGGVEACDDANQVWADGCNPDCVVSGTPLWTVNVDVGGFGDDEEGRAVAVANTGEIYVAGLAQNVSTKQDLFLWQYSSDGLSQWTYSTGTSKGDVGAGVAADDFGRALVTGTLGSSKDDAWTGRVAGGALQQDWLYATSRADTGEGIAIDIGHDYVVVGTQDRASKEDIWVRKYDHVTGALLWTRAYDGGKADFGRAVATYEEDAIVVGTTNVPGKKDDIWIRRYDDLGGERWTQTYDGGADDRGWAVAVFRPTRNFYVAGETQRADQWDAWVAKYPEGGGPPEWVLEIDTGEDEDEGAYGIATDWQGNVVVVGYRVVAGQSDIWVRKIDSNGTQLWEQTYDGGQADIAHGVAIDAGMNVIAVGTTKVPGEKNNLWLTKYAP